MNSIELFTVGYEDRTINDFIERLLGHRISILVDVREIPASRKKGFSKNQLNKHLEDNNIQYIHIKELGSPKELREKLYEDSNYDAFFKKYKKYLDTQEDVVEMLYTNVVAEEISCIMCMERMPSQCHRKVIAEKIKEIDGNGLKITHI